MSLPHGYPGWCPQCRDVAWCEACAVGMPEYCASCRGCHCDPAIYPPLPAPPDEDKEKAS